MLIEKDEQLKYSCAGVAWKEKGVAGRKSGSYAV